jgi:hypothetical protein
VLELRSAVCRALRFPPKPKIAGRGPSVRFESPASWGWDVVATSRGYRLQDPTGARAIAYTLARRDPTRDDDPVACPVPAQSARRVVVRDRRFEPREQVPSTGIVGRVRLVLHGGSSCRRPTASVPPCSSVTAAWRSRRSWSEVRDEVRAHRHRRTATPSTCGGGTSRRRGVTVRGPESRSRVSPSPPLVALRALQPSDDT